MNKKLFIGLAPLLAIAAFAVMPVAAQATESNGSPVHWQKNGIKTPAGLANPVITWGTTKLESAAGTITCRNSAAGNNTNTAGGEAISEVVASTTYECKAGGECPPPAEERATAFNLTPDTVPNTGVWPSVLQEEGPVLEGSFRSIDKSEKGAGENPIKVNLECYLNGEKFEQSLLFVSGQLGLEKGESKPLVLNGTSATKPSETSFEDPAKETGFLIATAEAELVKEEVVEPAVKIKLKEPIIKDEPPGTKFAPLIKAGCRVKASNLFPNVVVKEVKAGAEEIVLENKVNPANNFGLKNAIEPVKFNCGALTTVQLHGTTHGKVKFVGYLDSGLTPLVTVGRNGAP